MAINIYGGSYRPRIRRVEGVTYIRDDFRERWLVLQPEEMVRQCLLHYLVGECGYSRHRVGIEQRVEVNGQPQRADVLVYDRRGGVYLLVECKAPCVQLSESALSQAVRYSVSVAAQYMAITNGSVHYIFHREGQRVSRLQEYPPAP